MWDRERKKHPVAPTYMFALVLQADLKLEWGREKYIDCLDGEDRGAIAWLRFRGWMIHYLCPLRNEQDSWVHIVANCPENERLRWQLPSERYLMSECGRLEYWDLIPGYESGNEICKYLVKVRKFRGG